jgi:hypothetical protein
MRAEEVDVHARRGSHPAAVAADLVHHDRCLGDTQAGPTVFHWHGDAQPPGLGHRRVELPRELAVFVAREPVLVVERPNHAGDTFADGPLVITCRKIHLASPFGQRTL